ncbi:metal ABC transporter solute-binding protein, Zn/Mn family [Arcobacter sp. LA11]|uniref:metal ABC transporter solute-binding protein, Zn/Mn family n=1 Tax=Arcobacter sp. LA11 TaxID=1898176 RepID=UPI000932BAB0|nr:zinc ABC transporter substrate-binding protein [Arcobacter sp. LA11]
MFKILTLLLLSISFLYSKTHITVTLPVQKYFIEKITKNDFVIHVVEDRYKEFDKKNKDIIEPLAYSKVYFTLALDREKEYIDILKAKNKHLKIKDLTRDIKKDFTNGEINPYIWIDPLKVRELSKNILNELIKLKSHRKEFFLENYNTFLNEIDEMFLYIKGRLDKSESYNIFVYEPYWHYFAKRFRLNLYYRENRYTTLEEVSSVIKLAKKHDIRKLIIEKGTSYEQGRSLVSHINASIVEHDVNAYEWRSNLYFLTREITKK